MTIEPGKVLLELYEADEEKYFEDREAGPLFDPPSVGVASADDPWFARFKELIGDFHWTPDEALRLVAPDARARSVICWTMPIGKAARQANRRENQTPARGWAYVRTFGEMFLDRMRRGLEEHLRDAGFAAVAPHIAPQNEIARRPGIGHSSCWSERHAAFVGGLGTFSLSGGLITSRGVAHRLSSVVTDAEVEPTPRTYGDDAFAWCLRTAQGICGACIRRCPTTSIGETVAERDKDACRQYGRDHIVPRADDLYGWEGGYGCGLCQTAVPCEERNPTEDQ